MDDEYIMVERVLSGGFEGDVRAYGPFCDDDEARDYAARKAEGDREFLARTPGCGNDTTIRKDHPERPFRFTVQTKFRDEVTLWTQYDIVMVQDA